MPFSILERTRHLIVSHFFVATFAAVLLVSEVALAYETALDKLRYHQLFVYRTTMQAHMLAISKGHYGGQSSLGLSVRELKSTQLTFAELGGCGASQADYDRYHSGLLAYIDGLHAFLDKPRHLDRYLLLAVPQRELVNTLSKLCKESSSLDDPTSGLLEAALILEKVAATYLEVTATNQLGLLPLSGEFHLQQDRLELNQHLARLQTQLQGIALERFQRVRSRWRYITPALQNYSHPPSHVPYLVSYQSQAIVKRLLTTASLLGRVSSTDKSQQLAVIKP